MTTGKRRFSAEWVWAGGSGRRCGCRRACPVMFVLVVATFGE
jgi:hypothetical protein